MEINWNDIVGEVLTQILRILLPIVIVLCIKWLSEIYHMLREKNPKLAEAIALAGQLGYSTAEEYFNGTNADGTEKMDFALARAQSYLHTLGWNIDLNVIRDSIVNYGVTNYKFSWCKKPLDVLWADHIAQEQKPEEEILDDDDTEGDQS